MISATTADVCRMSSNVYSICILWISAHTDFSTRWGITVKTCRLPLPWLYTDFFHPLGAESAHVGSGQRKGCPYMSGTKCGVQDNAAELRNLPSSHLATGRAQAVPIYSPGMLCPFIAQHTIMSKLKMVIMFYYTLFHIIEDLLKHIISPWLMMCFGSSSTHGWWCILACILCTVYNT